MVSIEQRYRNYQDGCQECPLGCFADFPVPFFFVVFLLLQTGHIHMILVIPEHYRIKRILRQQLKLWELHITRLCHIFLVKNYQRARVQAKSESKQQKPARGSSIRYVADYVNLLLLSHPGPNVGVGRAAPELDVFEAIINPLDLFGEISQSKSVETLKHSNGRYLVAIMLMYPVRNSYADRTFWYGL